MKVLKEGRVNNPMIGRITCKLCGAELEITPEDCDRTEIDFNIWFKCPCCEQRSVVHAREVGILFWYNIKDTK